MKHILLTGEIGVGKSTVIRKTLSHLNMTYGGFCTYFGEDRASADRCLYIGDAAKPHLCTEENAVVRFVCGKPPEPIPQRFDLLGAALIQTAGRNAQIIIMDELGRFERDALVFQSAVLEALNGDVPVFGVIKKTAAGWVDIIRRHPCVSVIDINMDNRDHMPAEIMSRFVGQLD